jgi:hypothetical protein
MSKFVRKTVVAAKLEVTPGTDIVPGAADCVMVRNPQITPLEMSYAERQLVRGFFGNYNKIPTIRKVKVTFEVELQASGTAGTAPAWDALMQACGCSSTVVAVTSVTYAPLSPGVKTISLYYNVDGTLHKMVWGRGNVTIKLKANDIPVLAFEFTGLDTGATDTTILTPSSFGSYKDPLAATKVNTPTFSFFGVSTLALESLELNLGNQIEQVSRIGSEQILHTDRKAAGSVMFEMTTVAVKDWMAQVKNGTQAAINLVHGTGAGLICTLAGSNIQVTNPRFSEQQGIQMLQLDTLWNPTVAGNDEFSLALT